MAPTLKLTYFNIKARAEPIRLAFAIGGIDFEDIRLTREEFQALKPSLPYGQLPVLEVDGVLTTQMLGMLHYAGKLTGLFPSDPVAALRVDEILLTLEDMQSDVRPSIMEKDEAKRLEMRKALAEKTLPKWLSNLEKRIADRGTEYAAGNELTVADLALYVRGAWIQSGVLDGIPKDILDAYPKLISIIDKVAAHPKVKEWNEKH